MHGTYTKIVVYELSTSHHYCLFVAVCFFDERFVITLWLFGLVLTSDCSELYLSSSIVSRGMGQAMGGLILEGSQALGGLSSGVLYYIAVGAWRGYLSHFSETFCILTDRCSILCYLA